MYHVSLCKDLYFLNACYIHALQYVYIYHLQPTNSLLFYKRLSEHRRYKKNNNNLNKTQDNIHDKNIKPMRHTLTHACVFYTVYGTVKQKVLQSQSSDFKFYKGKIGRDWRTYMLKPDFWLL